LSPLELKRVKNNSKSVKSHLEKAYDLSTLNLFPEANNQTRQSFKIRKIKYSNKKIFSVKDLIENDVVLVKAPSKNRQKLELAKSRSEFFSISQKRPITPQMPKLGISLSSVKIKAVSKKKDLNFESELAKTLTNFPNIKVDLKYSI